MEQQLFQNELKVFILDIKDMVEVFGIEFFWRLGEKIHGLGTEQVVRLHELGTHKLALLLILCDIKGKLDRIVIQNRLNLALNLG